MNKVRCNVWGRLFYLNVSFENDSNEEITETQKAARENLNDIDFSSSLTDVVTYINKHDGYKLKEKISNIFKYVMPRSILILDTGNIRSVVLLCDYRLDIEHGIAILFEDEHFKLVGSENRVL